MYHQGVQPSLETRSRRSGGMKISDIEDHPNNLSFHNLCTSPSPPVGCRNFLGLNLNFCISHPNPEHNTYSTIRRLVRAVRIRDLVEHMLAAAELEEYIPKLYLPWEGNPSFIDQGPAEAAILSFAAALEARKKYHAATAYKRWNLSHLQRKAWKTIVSDRRFIIMRIDKKLGPVIMERATYLDRVMVDHLCNPNVYTRLEADETTDCMEEVRQDLIDLFHFDFAHSLTKGMKTYFRRARTKKILTVRPSSTF